MDVCDTVVFHRSAAVIRIASTQAKNTCRSTTKCCGIALACLKLCAHKFFVLSDRRVAARLDRQNLVADEFSKWLNLKLSGLVSLRDHQPNRLAWFDGLLRLADRGWTAKNYGDGADLQA